tara:strand:- start:117 stop:407 length:291 start_codon:yes stop_codon:yes gene_type:complete
VYRKTNTSLIPINGSKTNAKILEAHDLLIYLSGVTEIFLGIRILFSQTRSVALWGVIAMLIVFLIVHVNMLSPSNQLGIFPWILWLRIPIQFILIC